MNLAKNIRNTAARVLQNESNAILKLIDYLDGDFDACVEQILHGKGRVVITGVGKSAIIGNKIVATLNSTGTPALFMHAADAIHGDLGMIQDDDIVLCISKSGNTPEIKVLVPLLKKLGSKLVAMVSNTQSYLAKQSDYVLNATIGEEACPNNLAPTTSTTAHLALGDALAVCLLEARGFSSEDFAKYHPGGSLGKQLYLRVADLIGGNEIPVVSKEAGLAEVILEISGKRLGATAVSDESGRLLGIITDGDLRRMLQKTLDIASLKAEDIMTSGPKTIDKDEYAIRALNMMRNHNITQLVAMDGENIAGFIHIHELMKEGIV
ncbi:KpsF/GutQ family sugar-phosphate isomerase [Algoriphagus zhangzhouensis]|uniref:Arabinose-5-phosphate isomerase n=1 Tax=Algoriphagus zhangzhouensis TaxID=1073327 RepID=A0A1M7ZEE3_9BACT|nr:KpsF/GutQ family sugar-phosphate isomerase [Algoriphagus zhangzhouensis]TDY45996.1 arabinose-5-phosphate isomerase [Algoriphagus zhangzhouensis]SHO63212.1 arabinose-5-phosphate isomerase [Algoriphagus zhangzhouensis]